MSDFLQGIPRKIRLGRGTYWLPNRTGLNRFAESNQLQAALERRAQKIIDAYDPKMSGAGGSSWTFVEPDPVSPSVKAGTRFPFAHLDEWGSVNNPPYGSMRRAVARAGFTYKAKGKGG